MTEQQPCDGNFVDLDLLRPNRLLRRLMTQGLFGLEKEHVRCTEEGHLAMSPHPEALGNKADHPYITTDFSESQVEMITPPLPSVKEAHGFMKTLHQIVVQALPHDELLWMQSMPPVLPAEQEIPLAQFWGSSRFKTEYRERLSQIYGRGRQMISGSHFNFSFPSVLFDELSRITGVEVHQLESKIYMKMVRNLMRYRWWLVGALGRSPSCDPSLKLKALDSDQLFQVCCDFGVSIRSSRIGYRNPHPLETVYCTLADYTRALDEHINSGKLLNPNELYMPVRLKLDASGQRISHLEIRLLDLDPFDPIGLSEDSLRVLHLFCLFALLEPESGPFTLEEQSVADAMQNHIATMGYSSEIEMCCGDKLEGVDFVGEALVVLQKMESIASLLSFETGEDVLYQQALITLRNVVEGTVLHPSAQIIRAIREKSFLGFHLEKARESAKQLRANQFQFFGMEDMELSTQLLLKEAVRRGVLFDILDRGENFVRLHKLGKEEYVMQATRTSLDKYSSVLLMENKLTTKEVLGRAGIRVPNGFHFRDLETAKAVWDAVKGQAIVVKPKTTNFGLGITILKENLEQAVFDRAVELAFEEDREILIEYFVKGKEYRFFLIDCQVVGVLHRVPANVKGDGLRSIRELVAEKNLDPLRGKGYRTPLEKIDLGEAESIFLASQELHFESVPDDGKTVFLRENSNISTGGDSLDYTEKIHPSYHEIASRAAKALDVRITGLDMMIEDVILPASDDNYAIIEMNFNPAIHIHCYPYEGRNRHLDKALLNQLGFL